MKIEIFGDSFGLPRFYKQAGFDFDDFGKPEKGKTIELHYEDTYPEKLRQGLLANLPGEDIAIINHCEAYHNSFNLLTDFKTAYLHQPDYIVVQIGIVDCFPRKETDYVPFPFMKGKNPWVNQEEFRTNLLSFLKLCLLRINSLKSITLVNIVKSSESHNQRHAGSIANAVAYNRIIADLCRLRAEKEKNGIKSQINVKLADLFGIVETIGEKALCRDGVHINAISSQYLADSIVKHIVHSEAEPNTR